MIAGAPMREARLVVTGAQGFLGRALVARARARGARVLGIGRRSGERGTEPDARLDLRDRAALHACLAQFAPDVVLHAAGAPHHADAARLAADNVDATACLAAVHRALPRPARLLFVSSAAVYGDAGAQPWRESLPLAPIGPYGHSKAAAERLAVAAGGDVVVARVFNLCGPGQDQHHVCGALVRRVAAVVRGEASALAVGPSHTQRDFLDVRDAADALLLVAASAAAGAVVNVGSGRGTAIVEVVAHLLRLAGLPPAIATVVSEARAGVACSVADVAHLRALGFEPRHELHATLAEQLHEALSVPA